MDENRRLKYRFLREDRAIRGLPKCLQKQPRRKVSPYMTQPRGVPHKAPPWPKVFCYRPIFPLDVPIRVLSAHTIRRAGKMGYSAYARACAKALWIAAYRKGYRKALVCPCRQSMVIYIVHLPRILDETNLAEGLRPIEDMLTWRHGRGMGWIPDDSPKWMRRQVRQEKCRRQEPPHVEIVICEVITGQSPAIGYDPGSEKQEL